MQPQPKTPEILSSSSDHHSVGDNDEAPHKSRSISSQFVLGLIMLSIAVLASLFFVVQNFVSSSKMSAAPEFASQSQFTNENTPQIQPDSQFIADRNVTESPTPTLEIYPVSDSWITFSSKESRFSFSYPANWNLRANESSSGGLYIVSPLPSDVLDQYVGGGVGPMYSNALHIMVYPQSSFAELTSGYLQAQESEPQQFEINKKTINGKDALVIKKLYASPDGEDYLAGTYLIVDASFGPMMIHFVDEKLQSEVKSALEKIIDSITFENS